MRTKTKNYKKEMKIEFDEFEDNKVRVQKFTFIRKLKELFHSNKEKLKVSYHFFISVINKY